MNLESSLVSDRTAHDRMAYRNNTFTDPEPLARRLRAWRSDCRVRFLIAGGAATLVNWLVRFPLDVMMPYAAAVALAAACHMALAFVLYRVWVFPGSDRHLLMQISDFILINLVSMAVTVGVSVALRQVLMALGIGPLVAAAAAHFVGIGSGAIAGYIGHRRITFRSQRDAARSALARSPARATAPAE